MATKAPKMPKMAKYPKKPRAPRKPKQSASADVWDRFNERVKSIEKAYKARCKDVDKKNADALKVYKQKVAAIENAKRRKESLKKSADKSLKSLAGVAHRPSTRPVARPVRR